VNLLAVSSWCPAPQTNGSKLRAFHLLRQLCRRHTVRLVTFAGDGDDVSGGDLASLCASVEAVRWDPFLRSRPGLRGLLSSWPRSLVQTYSHEMAARVRARLSGSEGAIAFQLPAALYLAGAQIPVVLEELELGLFRDALTSASSMRQRLRRQLTWWKSARFVRGSTDRAAETTVTSEVELAHLMRIGCDGSRMTVVPNGVAAADLDIEERPEPATLIYPGAITYSANLDAMQYFLADIWPRIRRSHPAATLRITGEVDAAAAASLPLVSGVTLTGLLADVRPVIAGSRVCVVPLRRGGGTRLKILQAMALGTPVVSTSKGAEGLAVTDGTDIVLADDPGRFAEQVGRLIDDDALRQRLSERGRALVRREYTWERAGDVLSGVVARALAGPLGGG
jgi:glycosyltransferase involved in cell wall biosynthesis